MDPVLPVSGVLRMCMIVAAVVICLPGCGSDKNNADAAAQKAKGRPNNIAADVHIVASSAYSPSLSVAGRLLANEEAIITPEASGKITAIYFQEGSQVRKGQTLVQLNDADLRAAIQKLESQRALQRTLRSRQQELVSIGGISRQEYDATGTAITSLDADIAAQQAMLAKLRVVAPFAGRIGLRNVSVGAVISPGTAITSLQQTQPLKLEFSVPDQYREALHQNAPVPFTIAGLLDSFGAKVYAIEPGAGGSTASLRVRAMVQNPNNRLAPGSVATVRVAVGTGSGQSIIVPSQCVVPSTRDRKVMLVRGGKVTPTTVITGERTSSGIQILNGLQAGDTILATGMMQAKPGMDVKVRRVVEM